MPDHSLNEDKRIRDLRKQLNRARWGGGILLATGLVNLLDSYTPWPIPLTGGPAWMASIFLIIVGGAWFYQYIRPRVDEIVHLGAKHTGGYLTVVIVHELLGIPVKIAAKTLLAMYREGIIQRKSAPGINNIYECVFQVPNIDKPAGPVSKPAALGAPVTIDEINKRFLGDMDSEDS
jgi:hypothetical protein